MSEIMAMLPNGFVVVEVERYEVSPSGPAAFIIATDGENVIVTWIRQAVVHVGEWSP